MCGIVGYTGNRSVAGVLVDGLRRLEYRGYDSAGLAVVSGGELHEAKAVGKVRKLEEVVAALPGLGSENFPSPIPDVLVDNRFLFSITNAVFVVDLTAVGPESWTT